MCACMLSLFLGIVCVWVYIGREYYGVCVGGGGRLKVCEVHNLWTRGSAIPARSSKTRHFYMPAYIYSPPCLPPFLSVVTRIYTVM